LVIVSLSGIPPQFACRFVRSTPKTSRSIPQASFLEILFLCSQLGSRFFLSFNPLHASGLLSACTSLPPTFPEIIERHYSFQSGLFRDIHKSGPSPPRSALGALLFAFFHSAHGPSPGKRIRIDWPPRSSFCDLE